MNRSIRAAELLIEARTHARPIDRLPEDCAPVTADEAYAIQDAIIARAGAIGGWKTAPRPDGGDFLCSPIPAAFFHADGASVARADMLWPEAELEVGVRFDRDLPPRSAAYSADEIIDAIADVVPVVEILSSRFCNRRAIEPRSSMADLQSCGAVVVGTGRADWRSVEAASLPLALWIDGEMVGSVDGGANSHHLAVALAWLANHAAARCGGLKRGNVVITGARVGPFPVRHGSRIVAVAQSLGTVSFVV